MQSSKDVFFTYDFQYGSSCMTEEEAWQFLESPDTRTLILSTVGPDNVPQSTPIYFHVHDRKLYFNAIKEPPKKKVRNIMHNPNVCLTADRVLPDGGYYWVSVIGTARLIASERSPDEGEQAFVEEYTRKSSEKYGGQRRLRGPGDRSAEWGQVWIDVLERIYLEVTPRKILSYDVRKKTSELFEKITKGTVA